MLEQAIVPTSFIAVLQRYIDNRSIDIPELSQKLVKLQTQSKMTIQEYDRLLHQLQQQDPVPAFGVKIGQMIEPKDFGLVGYLVTACSNLGQALARYGRFQTLVLSELRTQEEVNSDVISHRWNLHDVDTPLSCEFGVAIYITLFQSLIAKAIAPIEVGLPFDTPADASIYKALFGCPVVFNSPCLRVDLPANIMRQSISSRDPYMRKIFDSQAEAMLEAEGGKRSDSFDDFFETLQEQILMAMKDGDTKASTVAKKMGFSLRGFYRTLEAKGYSYRSLVAGLRSRLAKKYLMDVRLTFSDVALLLGYSEQSAFIRAFKKIGRASCRERV